MHIYDRVDACDNGIFFTSDKYEHADDNSPEIMQFIGRQDRNGVDIYEGDIVTISRYQPESLWLVKVEDIRRIPEEFYGSSFNWCKVDGNKFQNPELGRIPAPQPPQHTTTALCQ
jgi:uncharacterized phage protein (TIGR01671 family)